MKRFASLIVLVLSSAGAAAAVLTISPGEEIQSAVNKAKSGDTIKVMPGLYKETVYIDKDGIKLSGVIHGDQWPVLDGEDVRHDGILVSGHGVTVEKMHVKRFRGNGIMLQGGNNFSHLNNWVEGYSFYGIFPQYGKNGLVANNIISGVADAGIYAGMCENVDIIANETFNDTLGIEVEDSLDMLVEGNYVHHNSIGVIIDLVPGLPVKRAEKTVVRNNFILDNNAKPNSTSPLLSSLHEGVGVLIRAHDHGSIEGNIIRNNVSAGIVVEDLTEGFPDPKADPFPDNNRILGNLFFNNGQDPRTIIKNLLAPLDKKTGPDLLVLGRGKNNCVSDKLSLTALGADSWNECAAGATTADVRSVRLATPVESPRYTLEQRGRLTYMAVCSGCHSYSARLVGPPMVAARARYAGNPKKLAEWIANPTKRRADYGEMPPQRYLPEEVRVQVASYILNELDQ